MSQHALIRVPATSANLGTLFDCAALALNLYLDIHVTPCDEERAAIVYRGLNPDRVAIDDTNLVARVIRETLHGWQVARAFRLEIENQIPVAAGLGSSAAATVAGLIAAFHLAERPIDEGELLARATRLEGHPDNVAAAWHGGFTVALEHEGCVLACSCPVPQNSQIVLVVPDYAVPTTEARAVLPHQYAREDAVHNLQRAVAVAAQFFSGQGDLQPIFFQDRWHQPYRARLMPGLAEVLDLRLPELLGICLSGAGPSILAFARGSADFIAKSIKETFLRHGIKTRPYLVEADNRGAKGWALAD